MQENTSAEIQLEGHTDIEGNAQGNMNLSKSRVEVIRNYLMKNKINKKRIRLKWFGASKPIRTDGTYEDRKINRRVECILIKK
jgi:outer membrane protein OmpA-like peptidoglycan-associated protein